MCRSGSGGSRRPELEKASKQKAPRPLFRSTVAFVFPANLPLFLQVVGSSDEDWGYGGFDARAEPAAGGGKSLPKKEGTAVKPPVCFSVARLLRVNCAPCNTHETPLNVRADVRIPSTSLGFRVLPCMMQPQLFHLPLTAGRVCDPPSPRPWRRHPRQCRWQLSGQRRTTGTNSSDSRQKPKARPSRNQSRSRSRSRSRHHRNLDCRCRRRRRRHFLLRSRDR